MTAMYKNTGLCTTIYTAYNITAKKNLIISKAKVSRNISLAIS